MILRKSLILVACFSAALAARAARAEEPVGCAAFKWSIAEDQTALSAEKRAMVENGGALAYGAATTARLAPLDAIRFPSPPERAPKLGTFAAIVTLPAPPVAGVYRLTLSDAAWVDAIQDGAALKPLAFSGARDCPHVRKTLKFQLSDKPLTLQISGAPAPEIALIVHADEAAPR
ncbi:hypothetical protein [Rhodoblastus sp.]|uniref:hypothetical protein n=1 Tax=Rhodoblastus sp. TaxID=1962975 RepID=UPI0035B468A3